MFNNFSVLFPFIDSYHLFGIFKLLLHIKRKDLLDKTWVTLASLTILTRHWGFLDPKDFNSLDYNRLTLSVPTE
jgi:hypothetical protein